jgi:hypothetical protein
MFIYRDDPERSWKRKRDTSSREGGKKSENAIQKVWNLRMKVGIHIGHGL